MVNTASSSKDETVSGCFVFSSLLGDGCVAMSGDEAGGPPATKQPRVETTESKGKAPSIGRAACTRLGEQVFRRSREETVAK